MFSIKMIRLILAVSIIGLGTWLLARPAPIQQETVQRQEAILQAFGPAGFNSDNAVGSGQLDSQLVDVIRHAPVEPVVVDLAALPSNQDGADSQYDRWQRGEIDLENEGLRSDLEMEALRREALTLPGSESVAASGPDPLSAQLLSSFASLDYTESGGGFTPPDPELAVSNEHVIAVVNTSFEIYDWSGTSVLGPTTFVSFMSSNPNCNGVFDPNVLYDEAEGRWMLGIDADGDHYCAAVSQTSDPTGSWNIYAFQTATGGEFFDYPHVGVGRDAIYMGANIFTSDFLEGRLYAMDKTAMYAGGPATMITRGLGNTHDTPQPANLHGYEQGTWPPSGPHYIIVETGYDGANHTIFSWADPFGANTFSTVGTVDLVAATGVAAGMPVNSPQLGSSATLQANDYRPQDFDFRNGYAWTSMAIACNPGSGTVNCVRWAQIELATATVAEAGVLGTDGEYRYFPDVAANRCGDMMIGYTKSSSSMYPAVYYTGRLSGDPGGSVQTEAMLKAGEITYIAFDSVPHRWGDYTEMTIAPDGSTFWYLGEYSKNTGTSSGRWGTYIGSFEFPSCPAYKAELSLTSQAEVAPGGTITHSFVLHNNGQDDSYDLTVNNASWNTTLLTGSPLAVTSGMTTTIMVEVTAPDTPWATDSFQLRVTSVAYPAVVSLEATGTTTATVTAAITPLTLKDGLYSQLAPTGESVTYTVYLTNTGTYTDMFAVALSGNAWTTSSSTAQVGPLAPGEMGTFQVFVTVGTGLSDQVQVAVTSTLDNSVSQTALLITRVRHQLFLPAIIGGQ